MIAGFRLVGFEIAGERSGDIGRQHLREIHDTACEWRHVEREDREAKVKAEDKTRKTSGLCHVLLARLNLEPQPPRI